MLGCTHYPFAKAAIHGILGEIPLYDGGYGTARQTKRCLEEKGLLSKNFNTPFRKREEWKFDIQDFKKKGE